VEGEEHGGDLIDAAGVFVVRVFGIKGRKLGGESRVGEVGGDFRGVIAIIPIHEKVF
jgi:hypothetical protein